MGYRRPYQVLQRLELIRYVNGLTDEVNLSVAQLRGLWGILTSPAERELCLSFLQEGASIPKAPMAHLLTAFGDKVRYLGGRPLILSSATDVPVHFIFLR